MILVQSILGTEFKNFLSTNRACKFTQDGCVLESKFGSICLKFKQGIQAEIQIKKLSGNGKFVIKSGEIEQQYSTHTRMPEIFWTAINDKIEILRPSDSTGEISIVGINLYNGDIVSNNWKAIIAKCGKYSCLRVIGDKLFASEGAFIEKGEVIESFLTEPANFGYRDGNVIKFRGSCEITNISLNSSAKSSFSSNDLYPQLDAPISIIPELPSNQAIESKLPSRNFSPRAPNQKQMKTTQDQSILNSIYDSSVVNEFTPVNKPRSKIVSFINSNGQNFLLLRKGGEYEMNVSNLQPNTEYVIVVSGKRVNGNGRLVASILSSDKNRSDTYETFIMENKFHDVYLRLRSSDGPSGGLKIGMTIDAHGEILISRIRILDPKEEAAFLINNYRESKNFYRPNLLNNAKKSFVIVIPSYNNEKWCQKNIESALSQNYDQFRIIFTDDCSTDNTYARTYEVVKKSGRANKCTLFQNKQRFGALSNLYNMIHSCDDEEIVLTLDGDDWFPDENVLTKLNDIYANEDVWLTYGQYQNYPDEYPGIAQQIPNHIIKENNFRNHTWCASHLRTFYAWLFKNITKEDFYYQGEFMSMAWDMTIMFPMLEMAGTHSRFINDKLYIYNMDNPINDHKVNQKLQQTLDRYVRAMPRYSKLDRPNIHSSSIGLMIIATGKYHQYIQGLISSADNYFLKGLDVTYYLFSDENHSIKSNRAILQIPIEHRPWPHPTMDRYKHFTNNTYKLLKEDYLYYIDVDCLFVDHVGREVIGDLVGVQHCGYYGIKGPVEDRPESVLYADPEKYKYYFGGGFQGGRAKNYLSLSKWCYSMIEADLAKGITPKWHDESALNRYFLDNEPNVTLTPSYHYPQSNITHYKAIWNREFEPKILLLDKQHTEIRK